VELLNLYPSTNIVRIIISKGMRCVGHHKRDEKLIQGMRWVGHTHRRNEKLIQNCK
jgi:hypothetical protein